LKPGAQSAGLFRCGFSAAKGGGAQEEGRRASACPAIVSRSQDAFIGNKGATYFVHLETRCSNVTAEKLIQGARVRA
jgi:hypothetical protein